MEMSMNLGTMAPQKKILLVDDDFDSIAPLQMTLINLGFQPDIALSGEEAVRKMLHNYYDLVVLDWKMPGLNGDETLEKAQSYIDQLNSRKYLNYWKGRKAKVITFSGFKELLERFPSCTSFERVDHWEKPIRYHQLLKKVLQQLGHLGFF